MTENIKQDVKFIVHDTRNSVSDGMKCVGKGFCDMKIVSFIIGIQQKQRFLHYFMRYGARNAIFASKPKGASKATTCTTDSTRIIIGNNVMVA